MERHTIDQISERYELEVKDPARWQEHVDERSGDDYGSAIIAYAERCGKVMQSYIEELGCTLPDIFDTVANDANYEDVTGLMSETAFKILSECWKYGDELSAFLDGR